MSKASVPFFDYVFTFFNESTKVNCCHKDTKVELATCGQGVSCSGSCSASKASLCPSGNCKGDCEIPFEQQETKQIEAKQSSEPSWRWKWCPGAWCPVGTNPGCCFHPICRERKPAACWWWLYLTPPPQQSPITGPGASK